MMNKLILSIALVCGCGGGIQLDSADLGSIDFQNPNILTISPARAELIIGTVQQFSASQPVQWFVVEPNGGELTGAPGEYVALAQPGKYHLMAVSERDSRNSEVAEITIVAPTSTSLFAGSVSTEGGAGYVDAQATAARFRTPTDVVKDGKGNLYVADSYNNTIRKIDLATAQVTTVAGRPGEPGSEDGPGNIARFFSPQGLAIDGSGDLYVSDSDNATIRKITLPAGQVTTVAGTAGEFGSKDATGTAARFSGPAGLAIDGDNLFVAEFGNDTIRKIDLKNKKVTTLAGHAGDSGSDDGVGDKASFSYPSSIVVAGKFLYVTDFLNDTIRKIEISERKVTTLAGSATEPGGSIDGVGDAARFRSPKSIATDGAGHLFVGDGENHTIRVIDIASRKVETLAGIVGQAGARDDMVHAAQFKAPGGMAVEKNQLYLADTGNHTVRKINLTENTVSTFAGLAVQSGTIDGVGPKASFAQPEGVVQAGGFVYVAEAATSVIRQVDLRSGQATVFAGRANVSGIADGIKDQARFRGPTGLTADNDVVYVADSGNHCIRQLVTSAGKVTTFVGSAEIEGSEDGTGGTARFSRPEGIVADGRGHLYVTDTGNHTIRKIDIASRAVVTLAGRANVPGTADRPGTAARFRSPAGIAIDPTGRYLYIADVENHTVRQLDLTTQAVITFAGKAVNSGYADGVGAAARFDRPASLLLDQQSLYVGERKNGRVRKIDLDTRNVRTWFGATEKHEIQLGTFPGALSELGGMAKISAKEILLADRDGNLLVKLNLP